MAADKDSAELKLEIAHILTIDVVAYSALLIDEQRRLMKALNRVVRETPCFRKAEGEGHLLRLPTGDGMVLVFQSDAEAPMECAREIAAALKDHPEIQLRMGIHSGPVSTIQDVNDRVNVAGAGIDTAQRVMDCGDAGHILLSKHVAEDLTPFPRWNRYLHDLGECEVKHGRKISLVNFHGETFGNPARPQKLKCQPQSPPRLSSLRLIDFEGACRINERHVLPWGSPDYSPACRVERSCRQLGTREDDFALGVIAFQLMCGEFPPPGARARSGFCKRADCPESLRTRIEELLRY